MRLKGVHYLLTAMAALIFSFPNLWASTGFEKEIDNISKTMADKIAGAGKKKVAVVDFTDLQGNVTELGRFISEEFSISLASAGKGFIVVDRTHLKTLLKEHKLSSTGLIDPATARKLGKIAGVEVLVTGTLTPLGESVRIAVKILDTETAAVIDANRGNIAMTNAISELMGTGVGSSGGQKIPGYKPGKSIQTKVVEDFAFDVLHCKVSDRTVTCTVMITNKADDRELQIYGNTRIYDDFGNEYFVQAVQIANTKKELYDTSAITRVLISGVPTKTKFTFQGVSPEATMMTALKIHCLQPKRFWVNLSNIPITK